MASLLLARSPAAIVWLIAVLIGLCTLAFPQASTITGNPVALNQSGTPFQATVALSTLNPCGTPPTYSYCSGQSTGLYSGPLPPAALAQTFTDITAVTLCTGTMGQLAGPACSNPGLADGHGNVIAYAAPGTYWCTYYGPNISASVSPCIFPQTTNAGAYVDLVSNQAAINGIKTFTTQTSTVTPGIFNLPTVETNSANSLVNGVNPTNLYFNGSCCGTMDAFAGGILIPSGATVTTATGVAGYVDSQCDSGGGNHCNGAALFGVARAFSTNSFVEGLNTIIKDQASTTGHRITGIELDGAALGTPAQFRGIYLNMSAANMPAGANAIEIAGGKWGTGLTFDPGIESGNGQAMQLYMTCNFGGGACNSQFINFTAQNAGNVLQQVTVNADPTGDFVVNNMPGGYLKTNALNLTGSSGNPLITIPGTTYSMNIIVPNSLTGNRNLSLNDPGNTGLWGVSFNATTGVYQSVRGTAGCTTGSSAGNACATAITVTFNTTYADTNYSASCAPVGAPTNFPSSPYVVAKSTGSMTVNYVAITAAAASWPNIDCIVVHD